jgi:hypothetical protein
VKIDFAAAVCIECRHQAFQLILRQIDVEPGEHLRHKQREFVDELLRRERGAAVPLPTLPFRRYRSYHGLRARMTWVTEELVQRATDGVTVAWCVSRVPI